MKDRRNNQRRSGQDRRQFDRRKFDGKQKVKIEDEQGEKRFEDHSKGKGAKYTRGRGPLKLVYFEKFDTKEEAMKREYAIKKLTKVQKEELIGGFNEKLDYNI